MEQTYLGRLLNVALKPYSFFGDVSLLPSSVKSVSPNGLMALPDAEFGCPGSAQIGRCASADGLCKICVTISRPGSRAWRCRWQVTQILAKNGAEETKGRAALSFQTFRNGSKITSSLRRPPGSPGASTKCDRHLLLPRPEFRRAYTPTKVISGAQMHSYDVPSEITDPLVRSMYWDLMNNMRTPPYVPRFTVDPYMRGLY